MKNVNALLILSSLGVATAIGCGTPADRSGFDTSTDNTDPSAGGDNSGQNGGDNSMGPSFGGSGGSNSGGLALNPKNTTVIIDTATMPVTPATLAYKVMDGMTDVTGSATFTLDDKTLGSFSGATFTSVSSLPMGTLGKSAVVTANTGKGSALGSLTVVALRKMGPQRDFFFVEPYKDTPNPTTDTLKFSTNIQQVDVAFVMDTTGSMQGSIDNLKTALSGTLLTQLQAAIPNVSMAVVDHKDFGQGDPWGVNVRQVSTTNLTLVKNAVNAMSASGGGDEPEAQIGGMFYALTGQANNGSPSIAAHTPAAGTLGGVDFRNGSVPVVVEITDAHWKNPSGNVNLTQLAPAFTAAHAKFVDVTNGDNLSFEPDLEANANTLSDQTGSSVPASAFGSVSGCAAGQCCTGVNGAGRAATGPSGTCRLNFLMSGGNGVSAGIVNAIKAISVGSSFDVTAKASNDPTNAGGVDATKFIKALRAKDEGDMANNCPPHAATDTDGDGVKDTFTAVIVGTPVCFEVIPAENTTVPATKEPQFYKALIDVIGVQGNVHLDNRSVLFLVPPITPGVN
jgi:hypothetical protein